MIELRAGVIREVRETGPRRLRLLVEVGASPDPAHVREAWAFVDLGPRRWRAGQRVLCNTTAVSLGLGTGGRHLVVAPLEPELDAHGRLTGPADRGRGHIVKLRYTPLQLAVMAAEEPAAPYHRAVRQALDLAGLPVAVVPLHSMLAPIVAGLRWAQGGCGRLRVAYVMTDSAALPAALSDQLEALRRGRWVDLVVCSGQAFGGDLEAVHAASALAVAQRAGADVAIVGPGPGVVGTGTALGTTCLEVASVADLVGALGGRAVVVPRLSIADRRGRHRGLSHHDQTALGRLASRRSLVVLPSSLSRAWRRRVVSQASRSGILARHRVVEVEPAPAEALAVLPVPPESMGRHYDDDPPLFDACLAAGRLLASMAGGAPRRREGEWP
ncbi:DUF3866 family protein [Geochorda subterranea]|uniref:DUF3866 family protein n=1 Tax=Geochorda subterranea TaxID=3109564 RepID=A0ABZ1BKF9_9FIRM|nr:DUF3866 family protein [Limnochorda sp. LNt]WRP13294.1 DUF3866 family protein [Limnochorda sp. LNt]